MHVASYAKNGGGGKLEGLADLSRWLVDTDLSQALVVANELFRWLEGKQQPIYKTIDSLPRMTHPRWQAALAAAVKEQCGGDMLRLAVLVPLAADQVNIIYIYIISNVIVFYCNIVIIIFCVICRQRRC